MGPGKSLEAYTQEELEGILDEFATDEEVESLLKGYVTSDALDGTLGGYVTSDGLSSTLESYVTSEALGSTLEDYATEEYVTGTLESYVTSDSLSSTLESYVTSAALSETLENYVVSSVYEEESESLSGSLSTLQSSFSTLENTVEGISAEVGSLSAEISSVYVNLIDYDDLTDGTQVDDAGLSSSTVRTISSYIPVTAGEAYTLLANADTDTIYTAVGWFDSEKNFLSAEIRESTAWTEGQKEELAAPEEAAYAVVCWTTEFTGYIEFWGYTTVSMAVSTCLANLNVTAYGLSSRVAAIEDNLTDEVASEVSSQVEQLADSITAEVRENLASITYQYVNLVDYDEVEGGYLESDGSMGENSSWTVTDYMPVTGGDSYTVVLNSAVAGKIYAAWYDSDKNYLYTTAVSADAEEKAAGYEAEVTAPDDAAYARADWGTEDRNALGFWGWVTDAELVERYESGLCITAYGIESRVEAIEKSYASSSEISQLADSITATVKEELAESPYEYVNLIDYDEVETGCHIDTDGGEEEEEGWSASGYTPVEAGETYTAVMNTEMAGNVLAYWYDADQEFLSRTWVSTGTKTAGYETDVEAPEDAAWVRLTWGMEDADAVGLWCWTTDADLIESHESSVSITAYGISSRVEAIEEDYATSSEISQLADSISLSVSVGEDSVASITLKVGDEDEGQTGTIDLSGLVTFSDLETEGETTIHGANIKTGTLSADTISGGSIDAADVTINNLDADNITSGSLSASRISGGNLEAGDITLYNAFTVCDSDGTEYGTLGYMTGEKGSGETTYGIGLKNADGTSYIIVTASGARFTSGDYCFYITKTGHFEVTCEEFYVNNEKITFD